MFKEDTGVLTISGSGSKMKSFKRYQTPWYSYASKIKTLKLSNAKNLTNISAYAFADLVKLKSIAYNKNLKKIAGFSFLNTKSLKSIEIKSGVNSIGENAFKAGGLSKIIFKSAKTSVFSSSGTLPKKTVIYADNPSKAYNYAKNIREIPIFSSEKFVMRIITSF